MNPQDNNQGTPQQQVIERLKTAVNVLVTVSNNPSVDQLASAIGFTLVLNKLGKHATAVFSGDIPSTIEFLQPDSTIEKNTDGLRDFIISLDKSKADKLRYKVEENVVKIFITPYRTTLTDKDLVFSQGDFNVDAVIALGVAEREQLDQAIIAHGRILHDATVITVSAGQQSSSLGAINWQDAGASSLGEMLLSIGDALQPGLLDGQIATAYLTGIVAQTERFRNEKTTPKLMGIAAQLMSAGANQQLIASSLDVVAPVAAPIMPMAEPVAPVLVDKPVEVAAAADGALTIKHSEELPSVDLEAEEKPEDVQIAIDDEGNLSKAAEMEAEKKKRRVIEPLPASENTSEQSDSDRFAGGPHPFTANMSADGEDEPSTDPLTAANDQAPGQLLEHSDASAQPVLPSVGPVEMAGPIVSTVLPGDEPVLPAPVSEVPALTLPPALDNDTLHNIEMTFDSQHITQDPTSTLNEIEEVVGSPHLEQAVPLDEARNAVTSAIQATPYDPNRPEPRQALNANPFSVPGSDPTALSSDPVLAGLGLTDAVAPEPQPILPPLPEAPQQESHDPSGQAPPPVPPPMMPL